MLEALSARGAALNDAIVGHIRALAGTPSAWP
jgi:hypothetical protein